jgi:hypothetical protein
MGEVAFEHYRLQSLIGQSGMSKMSPYRAAHIIEPPACAQDGAQSHGFAMTPRILQDTRPSLPVESSLAATTGRRKRNRPPECISQRSGAKT